jgi:hypothetical protein
VRVPPLHLADDAVGRLVGSRLALLLGDHELPREVQQEVAEFLADHVGIILAQRVVEFEDLLDEVGAQRLAGLHPVPRAPDPQVLHEGDHSAEGRGVGHRGSVRQEAARGPARP